MMGSQITREVDSVALHPLRARGRRRRLEDLHRAGLAALPRRAEARPDPRDAAARARSRSSSTRSTSCPKKIEQFLDGDHPIEEIAQRFYDKPVLPLPRPPHRPAGRARGRAEAEGDQLHPDRGVLGRRDEARPDRAARRGRRRSSSSRRDIHVYDKLVSNIQEVRARGAHVIAIATDGNEDIQHHADDVIYVPKTPNFLQAVLGIIPLQLLALPDRTPARPQRRSSRATSRRPSPSNSA